MPYRCAPVGVVTADMAWMVVQEDGTPVGMSRFASQKPVRLKSTAEIWPSLRKVAWKNNHDQRRLFRCASS